MCGSTQEGTVNHHLGHGYVFSSCVALAMREDRMAKDDFSEAERGSSRLARKFGLLAEWTSSMQCAMHAARLPATASMLLSGSDCLQLSWVGVWMGSNKTIRVL